MPGQPTAAHARETMLLSGLAFLVVRCAVSPVLAAQAAVIVLWKPCTRPGVCETQSASSFQRQ